MGTSNVPKTFGTPCILDLVLKIVNFIKAGSLNTRQFKKFCKDINAMHEILLFHTAGRWLSKGNVLNHVFEMKDEIKLFSEFKNKEEFLSYFSERERERENLFDFALRTDTIIRLIIHKKNH